MPFWAFLHFYRGKERDVCELHIVSMPFWAFLHFYMRSRHLFLHLQRCVNALLGFPSFLLEETVEAEETAPSVSMPFWAFLHFYSTLLEPAEIKHFPDLFCRYLSENSENNGFQIVFCTVHNLFIFKCKLTLPIRPLFFLLYYDFSVV